jgi:hypothetical protein
VGPSEQSPAPNNTRHIGATLESAMGGPGVHGIVHLAKGIASAESAPMHGPQIDVHGSARVSEAPQPLGVVAGIVDAAVSPNTRSQQRWREIDRGNGLPTTLSEIADAVRQRFPGIVVKHGQRTGQVRHQQGTAASLPRPSRDRLHAGLRRQRRCRGDDGTELPSLRA